MAVDKPIDLVGKQLEKSSDNIDRSIGRALRSSAVGIGCGSILGPPGMFLGGFIGYMYGLTKNSEDGENDSLLSLRGEAETKGYNSTFG